MSLLKYLAETSSLVLCRPSRAHHLQLLVSTNALLSSLSKSRILINDTTIGKRLGTIASACPTIGAQKRYRHWSSLAENSFRILSENSSQQINQQQKYLKITRSNNKPIAKRFNSSNSVGSVSPADKVLPRRTAVPLRKIRPPIGVTELPERFKMTWPKVTLFGDSLTRLAFDVENGCWGSMLAHKLGDYFDVDARGFAGYNTRWAYDIMPKLFPKSYLAQVEIFVLLFGHNDSWEPSNPLHIPVDEYEKNLNLMIQYLLDNGLSRSKIILITPNWYHLPKFTQYHINQGLPTTQKEFPDAVKYGEAVIRIAKKEQIDFLDAFALSYKHDPLEELFCDGVHYSKKGAQLLFEHLWPIVDRKLADSFRKPSNRLFHACPWDEIPSVKAHNEAHTRRLEAEARGRKGY